jgi:ribosomal protein S1
MDGVVIGVTTYNIIVQLKYNVLGSVSKGNHDVKAGDRVKARILNIDPAKRKIKLAIINK